MKNIKTEETKLREEIEEELSELITTLKIFIPKKDYYLFKGRIGKLIDKAKLQQLLADKKMFQDAVDFLDMQLFLTQVKDKETGKVTEIPDWVKVILEQYTEYIQKELLKTLGMEK